VTLTITTDDPAGPCEAASDDVVINFYPSPPCSITGSTDVCQDLDHTYSGPDGVAEYLWTISGDGQILGDADMQTVEVMPTATGSYTLMLATTNEFDCVSNCHIDVEVFDCCDSETAFAVNLTEEGTVDDGEDGISECFINKGRGKSKRWGWSNGKFTPDGSMQTYSMALVAGAGRCNLESGTIVGQLDLLILPNGDIMVNYLVPDNSEDPSFDIYATLGTVHLYIGCQFTPKKLAPGQFPFKGTAEITTISGKDYYMASFTIPEGDYDACSDGSFYLIAHAEVEVCSKVPDSNILPSAYIVDDKTYEAEVSEEPKVRSNPSDGKFEVTTFPNPTIDILTVDLKGLQNERTFIRIYDLVGKMIKEVEVDPTKDTRLQLNLSDELKTGMYYLRVFNGDRQITKPVILIE
jgi:hypothetical protein